MPESQKKRPVKTTGLLFYHVVWVLGLRRPRRAPCEAWAPSRTRAVVLAAVRGVTARRLRGGRRRHGLERVRRLGAVGRRGHEGQQLVAFQRLNLEQRAS